MAAFVWLLLILLSVIWGGSFILVEFALEDFSPLAIVALRVSIAALFLHAVLFVRKIPFDWRPHSLMLFLVMGLLNNVLPFSLIFWGQETVEAGRASVFNATMPLFTVVFAHFLLKDERMTRARLLGVVLGFCGVFLLAGRSAIDSEAVNSVHGQLAVLAAAVSYALASIFGKRMGHIRPMVASTGMLTGSTVIMVPVILASNQLWPQSPDQGSAGLSFASLSSASLSSLIAVLLLGILCTAVAYQLYFKILVEAGPNNLSYVTFLIPPSAIVMGMLWLGESMSVMDAVGVVLILIGMAIATGLIKKRATTIPAK